MQRESTHPPVPVGLQLPERTRIEVRPKPKRVVPQFTTAREAHRKWVRALNVAGGSFEPVGRPDPDLWWDRAKKRNPLAGDPTPETRAALEAFTHSLNEDAALSFIGKIAAWIDCTRMAGTHLRVEQALRENPGIENAELPPPIFVLGLFRSGTTVLHRLLGRDPENRTLPHWESFDPTPSVEGPRRAQRSLSRSLMLADVISPQIKAIHPMDAYQTDECRGMFTNVFRTPQLNVQYRIPSYVDWLFRENPTIAYLHHRRQLQLAYHQRPTGKRLVLKDPTHTFFVDAILRVYPSAKFVFIHRCPVETLSSICSLHAYTRSVFSGDVDAERIGAELSESYMMTRLYDAVASVDRLSEGRVAHVRAPDLSRDAIGTIDQAYRELGLELGDEARRSMRTYLDEKRSNRGPKHIHTVEGFGLDAGAIQERFADYYQRFDLAA
jgi:hypothetical protein